MRGCIMKYLIIDTTSSHMVVSILTNNEILLEHKEYITSDMSSKILPIIDNLLKKLNFSLNDIDKILVSNGPGSFTGIRVGVTVCKTIAWALNKPIVPISSLEILSTTETSKEFIVPMIDARRGNVFAGVYDKNLNCIMSDRLINISELLKDKDDRYEFVSYDNFTDVSVINPNVNLIKIVKKHEFDAGVNPHNLNPNYLKLTEAEENRLKND